MTDFDKRLMQVRKTIISVARTQRGGMTDLAATALLDAAIDLGDIVLGLREQAVERKTA